MTLWLAFLPLGLLALFTGASVLYQMYRREHPSDVQITYFETDVDDYDTYVKAYVTWAGCPVETPVKFTCLVSTLTRAKPRWDSEFLDHFHVPDSVRWALTDRLYRYYDARDYARKQRYIESMRASKVEGK